LGLKQENRSKQEKTVLLQQLDKKMVSVLFIRRIALELEHLGESEFIFKNNLGFEPGDQAGSFH
jgi:hypothetical protein